MFFVYGPVSKSDTSCIISGQCISRPISISIEKQRVMLWHGFVLIDKQKMQTDSQKIVTKQK